MINTNKWALVTGASGGIGSNLCFQLGQKGYSLILCGRNKEKLEALAAEIPVKTVVYTADLSSGEGINDVLKIFDSYSISVFICNAGMGYVGSFANQSVASAEDMISVMVTASTSTMTMITTSASVQL